MIAQARFADELRIVNDTGVPFRYFFGGEAQQRYDVAPDQLIGAREVLTVGGTEFVLYPVRGGETADALLIHLPGAGVVFVGDAFMPYLGAPFLPEGSAEGLFETIALIRSLNPRTLVHGHPPLTDLFTIEALPGFEAALREVYERTLQGIDDGANARRDATAELVARDAPFPSRCGDALPRHPGQLHPARGPSADRLLEAGWRGNRGRVAPEWAAALNLLAGRQEGAFVRGAQALLEQRADVLALKVADLGLLNYPASRGLTEARRQALDRLRVRHQSLNPFKFIVYSEWAKADLAPVQ